MKKNQIINYWLFTVHHNGRVEDIKVFGYECTKKSDAANYARRFGRIICSINIYQKF